MAIEHASVQVVRKPWGVTDLRPWSNIDDSGGAVGELWFLRPKQTAPVSALLLKLLFTSEPLSIQVHPDDAFARSIGLPNGKTEAWYILSASPAARVAVGLKRPSVQKIACVDQERFDRRSRSMAAGHQGRRCLCARGHDPRHRCGHRACRNSAAQRRDIPSVRLWPAARVTRGQRRGGLGCRACSGSIRFRRLSTERMLLTANPHFVLERIDLAANTSWALNTDRETWFLVLDGRAAIGLAAASIGEAIYIGDDHTSIEVGPLGSVA